MRKPAKALPARLLPWVNQQLQERLDQPLSEDAVEALTGDVSPRRYFRVHLGDNPSLIVAHYPHELRNAYRAAECSTRLLEQAGITVAGILATDHRRELALLDDLGENSLYAATRGAGRTRDLYRQAVAMVASIGALDVDAVARINPPLGRSILETEIEQTWRLFLAPRLQSAKLRGHLRTALGELCRRLSRNRRVPCHRDFMARNLMVMHDDQLGVLDHQDLRLGPRFYDLASLLNDSLRLTEGQAHQLAETAGVANLLGYRRAAAQRCLKIVGTFHAFAERGSRRYLRMVPNALERALSHLEVVPETKAVVPALRRALENQPPSGGSL